MFWLYDAGFWLVLLDSFLQFGMLCLACSVGQFYMQVISFSLSPLNDVKQPAFYPLIFLKGFLLGHDDA